MNLWWYAAALVIADLFYWLMNVLYTHWADYLPNNQGLAPLLLGARITLAALAGLLLLTFLLSRSRRLDRSPSFPRRAILTAAALIFFLLHLQVWYICQHTPAQYVEDVGKTTLAAQRLLLHAHNPYSAPLDSDAEKLFPARHMGGYKYLPVMIAAYAPLAALSQNGDWSILASNLLFSILAPALLAACVRRWISLDAALFCTMLFFMPKIITEENFRHGNNDTVPMLLLMLGLFLIDHRLLCGLLVGLAISSKLLPGLLWIPLCLSPRKPARYFAGIVLGLLPCLPFLFLSPRDFLGNIFLFTLQRPIEVSSLEYNAPPILRLLIKLPAAAIFLLIARRAARSDITPLHRCALAAALALAVQLAAPMVHPNYFIWWFMPFCVIVTAFTFNPAAHEWIKRPAR